MLAKSNLIPIYRLAQKSLSDDLLQPSISQKIESLHAFLPQLNLVNYEFRLSNEDNRVDANFMVWRYEANILLDWLSDKEGAFYQQLRNWVRDWIDPNNSFHSMIDNIWIMFDLKSEQIEIPEPWIVFTFSELQFDKDTYISLVKRLAAYFDNSFTKKHWSILELIYSSLEDGQSVPAIGFQNRNLNSMRLGVRKFFDYSQITKYLKKISWPGSIEFIEKNYSQIIKESNYAMISMTFNDELLPEMGIECYMDRKENLKHSTNFLKLLVGAGLCSIEKSNGLINWIGDDFQKQEFYTLENSDYKNEVYIKKCLHEIKLVVATNGPAQAKAYVLIYQTYNSKLSEIE